MKKKRISTIFAVILIVTLLSSFVTIPVLANTLSFPTYPVISRVVDPDTSARQAPPPPLGEQMGFIDIPRVHDGRIWTDKTVLHGYSPDVDDFDIILSALSQSFPLSSGYAIPTDTVFIIDVSGSMLTNDAGVTGNQRTRIDVLIEGLNGAIGILQDAHPQNRIAVVAYGGGDTGSGLARVEHLLPLGRYTANLGSNEYFSYISNPNTQFRLQVNVGTNPRAIRVNASTPTQWGIFEGARILETATPKTAVVPFMSTTPGAASEVTVTRRPNIVLMTDGEPTMGWSNYLFAGSPAPANPVVVGPDGGLIYSPIPPGTAPGVFYGDGSWGEMGVSLLTVLTAAHRKREVLHRYFGGGVGSAPPGQPGQPGASVGFYSIAFGTQPSGTAPDLIRATMDPGAGAANANLITYDVRRGMSDLLTSINGPPPPVGQGSGGGANTFKMNDNIPPGGLPGAAPGYGGNMGALLRAFTASSTGTIEFHVSRRQAFSQYLWDTTPLSITNTAGLTIQEIDFADLFATATNLDQLNDVFRRITTIIQTQGIQDIVTAAGPEKSFDGYLSFSDVLGEYMNVRGVGGITYNNVMFTREGFAPAVAGDATQRNQYINILWHHMNYGTSTTDPMYLQEATVADLVTSNIANADFLRNNSIKYYANTNRDFVGSFFLPNGTPAPRPANAAAVVEVFPMWGTMNVAPAPPSGQTDLRLITFHVITALQTEAFSELYASNAAGDPMRRILNAGDQMIRWYIPSDMIPIRTPVFNFNVATTDPAYGSLTDVTGNTQPIRVNFTVGIDRARVSAGIPFEKFTEYQVPGTNDQMYFYSNRHTANPTNVTLAFFRPHPNNPFYIGVGSDERGVVKSQNVTQTAPHVSLNRVIGYTAGAIYDMHWLGNNGRLTMRLYPPPVPPTPQTPPSPQTGTGSYFIPIAVFLFGAAFIGGAEVYRRKSNKRAPKDIGE